MFLNILRVIIVYLVVLFVVRLMGKRQIGEMQPFELVITLIIADLATIPMSEHTLPLLSGILPVLTLLLVHYVLSFLSNKVVFARKLISGSPVVLISPNGVEYLNLKKLNININDLQESMRSSGYFNLSDVEYAIMETNGQVSFIPKSNLAPVVNEDLKIEKPAPKVPLLVVSLGKIIKGNLNQLGVNEQDVINYASQLSKKQVGLKDICAFTLTESGDAYFQLKGDKFIEGEVDIKQSGGEKSA